MKHVNKEWHKTELGWVHLVVDDGRIYLDGKAVDAVHVNGVRITGDSTGVRR